MNCSCGNSVEGCVLHDPKLDHVRCEHQHYEQVLYRARKLLYRVADSKEARLVIQEIDDWLLKL